MLTCLFGNKAIEKILFFLVINKECYATQLSKIFDEALSVFQKSLDRLESGGILISTLKGKTRLYQFNPRCPFIKELKQLINRAYEFFPDKIKETYYEIPIRKRPRRKGKPL